MTKTVNNPAPAQGPILAWKVSRSGAGLTVTGKIGEGADAVDVRLSGVLSVEHTAGAQYARDRLGRDHELV